MTNCVRHTPVHTSNLWILFIETLYSYLEFWNLVACFKKLSRSAVQYKGRFIFNISCGSVPLLITVYEIVRIHEERSNKVICIRRIMSSNDRWVLMFSKKVEVRSGWLLYDLPSMKIGSLTFMSHDSLLYLFL